MKISCECFSKISKMLRIHDILNFDNKALKCLPIDIIKSEGSRQVKNACFSFVNPDPVKNPKVVAHSQAAFLLLDVDLNKVEGHVGALTDYLCGNKIFHGSQPAAHCYCGHQFGNFAGQLGDGAAMYLGEVVNKNKERWEMQLKGSGKTPFSRSADGRKVLRSSLREFLCSEAMHCLGIPTSRAGSIVTSDTLIERDIFYDGHPIMEKVSVVLRIAPTFIRFGSFEICKSMDLSTDRQGPSYGNKEILVTLLQYVIETFYPEIWDRRNRDDLKSCYLQFFTEIVRRTATLVAKWQSVGFCHGVLNTDNMSIVGITIDYGPFGFMDRYDPNYICNASDTGGRYSYSNQPSICKWNCQKLAEAIKDILPLEESKAIIDKFYEETYKREYFQQMFLKIGMAYSEKEEDLVTDLLKTMFETGADYTNTFLALEKVMPTVDADYESSLSFLLAQMSTVEELKLAFKPALSAEDRKLFWRMAGNDKDKLIAMGGQFIIDEDEKQRLHEKLEKTSEKEQRDSNLLLWRGWIERYKVVLKRYWTDHGIGARNSQEKMERANPRVVLRNYLADMAIKAAEKNDFSLSQKLLERLERPFSGGDVFVSIPVDSKEDGAGFCERPPRWAHDIKVT